MKRRISAGLVRISRIIPWFAKPVYGKLYRGFESLPLRHFVLLYNNLVLIATFFFAVKPALLCPKLCHLRFLRGQVPKVNLGGFDRRMTKDFL